MHALERAIATLRHRLIKLDPNKVSIANLKSPPYKPDLAPSPILKLASLANLHGGGQIFQVVGITDFDLVGQRIFYVRVLLQELFLPFPEVLRQGVIGLLGHDVFLDLRGVFNFLMDRIRIQIKNIDRHITLHSIEIKRSHIFLHIGHNLPSLILEHKLQIIGLRAIASLHVLFQGEDGHEGIDFELGDFQAREIVLEVYFYCWGCLGHFWFRILYYRLSIV